MAIDEAVLNEERLPPLHRHLLLQIRKYGPFTAPRLREELETMRKGGADMRGLNVDEIHLALVHLEKERLIKLGPLGWERSAAEAVAEAGASKAQQKTMF